MYRRKDSENSTETNVERWMGILCNLGRLDYRIDYFEVIDESGGDANEANTGEIRAVPHPYTRDGLNRPLHATALQELRDFLGVCVRGKKGGKYEDVRHHPIDLKGPPGADYGGFTDGEGDNTIQVKITYGERSELPGKKIGRLRICFPDNKTRREKREFREQMRVDTEPPPS
jgi:hypothetical protein